MTHSLIRNKPVVFLTSLTLALSLYSIHAQTAEPTPSPYTVPWQLRPIMAVDVIRFDSALASYRDKSGNTGGLAAASVLTGAHKVLPDAVLIARLGTVSNSPPNSGPKATSFTNPLVGGLYSHALPDHFRLGLFFGVTAPIGSGGGNQPDKAIQSANSAGILARSAMDNALFAVNYFSAIPGIDFAYIADGLTLQVEATVFQLTRVRGEKADKDSSRTNFTSGFLAGYSITPLVFAEGELRYQRWLVNNTVASAANPAKQNLSFAVGPRFNYKIGSLTMRPGIAYAQGLVGPIASSGFTSPTNSDKILFIDIPIFF